jgi:hypothetical protein
LHNELAVFVDEIDLQIVMPLLHAVEHDSQGHGALRMQHRELAREDSVKCAKQIEFPVVIGRRIAQNRHLNGHATIYDLGFTIYERINRA